MTPPANGLRPPLDPGKPVMRRVGALGVFAPFLIAGILAIVAELDTSANTARVGECVRTNGTESAPEVAVVDCGSAEAEFKVAERREGSDARCDHTRFAEYAEYAESGGRDSLTLCLTPPHLGVLLLDHLAARIRMAARCSPSAAALLRWHRTTVTSFRVSICSIQDHQLMPKLLTKRCYFT
ncbi:hypothetical protein ACFU5O_33340 [Streptomyces sp. NPDC057445]|uniref:LppU/SCO3897 family protein n=1 Tax=Streptomyces sp. NPDC057445 TaxID=3346136 RepID=UPI003696F119